MTQVDLPSGLLKHPTSSVGDLLSCAGGDVVTRLLGGGIECPVAHVIVLTAGVALSTGAVAAIGVRASEVVELVHVDDLV